MIWISAGYQLGAVNNIVKRAKTHPLGDGIHDLARRRDGKVAETFQTVHILRCELSHGTADDQGHKEQERSSAYATSCRHGRRSEEVTDREANCVPCRLNSLSRLLSDFNPSEQDKIWCQALQNMYLVPKLRLYLSITSTSTQL